MAMIYTLVEIAREWLLDYNIETGVSAVMMFLLVSSKALITTSYTMRGTTCLPAMFLTLALVSPACVGWYARRDAPEAAYEGHGEEEGGGGGGCCCKYLLHIEN